jgi:anti-sigma regulatory factor (Ser/Thr protein kinase)
LRHEALIYGTEEEFLRGTLPFIRGAIDAGEPVKVVLPARRLAMVEEWIEDDGDVVEFVTMEAVGRNPARLISVWRDFVERHRDAARIRGVGEPAWADRSHDELVECCHHEALLNRAFEDGPEFRLLCPYDASALPADVVALARRNHPWIVEASELRPSSVYLQPEGMPDPLADPLPEPPPDAFRMNFKDRNELAEIRHLVSERAVVLGVEEGRVADFVYAVNELVTNSLRHGGGRGTLLMWDHNGALVCEVRDTGRITEPLIGRTRPSLDQASGRGVWLVNELCDLVQLRSPADGTRVRIRIAAAKG